MMSLGTGRCLGHRGQLEPDNFGGNIEQQEAQGEVRLSGAGGDKDDQEGHQSQILLILGRSCSAERGCLCNLTSPGTRPASFTTSLPTT